MADKCAAAHCWFRPSVEYGDEMLCKRHAVSRQRYDQRRAKILLDAAAPGLLAVCEKWLRNTIAPKELLEQARSAIAKAKGERG